MRSARIPNPGERVRHAVPEPAWLADIVLAPDFGCRTAGAMVTDHGSSWVRQLAIGGGTVFVKTYEYSTWTSRIKAVRRTGPGLPSRARREFDALVWLNTHDFPTAEPLAAFEARTCGFVRRAILVTRATPGEPAHNLLPSLDAPQRHELGAAIAAFVTRLHAAGFRDGNLDLRNLIVARTADGSWRVQKIDSPKFCLRPPGPTRDHLTQRDWNRLRPQLEALGLPPSVTAGADDPSRRGPPETTRPGPAGRR